MKKIVIISSTLRKNGNSEELAKAFASGATSKGHSVQFISIADLKLNFCIGCLHCQQHHVCVLKDDMNELYNSIQMAEILVFATPIYYYSISGQLKTFLDRLNPLYSRENKFKEIILLASAADEETSAINGAKTAIQGFVDCYDGVEFTKCLLATNVNTIGDIKNTFFLDKAYQLGNEID